MNNSRYDSRPILLLVVFLWAQFAAVQHSVEHPFHQSAQSCEAFLCVEKTPSLTAAIVQFAPRTEADEIISSPTTIAYSSTLTPYYSRAPPLSVFVS